MQDTQATEIVVYARAYLAEAIKDRTIESRTAACVSPVEGLEVGVQILELRAPVRRETVFEATACRPARAVVGDDAGNARGERRIETSVSETARAIKQHIIDRVTEATAKCVRTISRWTYRRCRSRR